MENRKIIGILLIIAFMVSLYYYLESSGITAFAVLTERPILSLEVTKFQARSNLQGQCSSYVEGIIKNTGTRIAENITIWCYSESKDGALLGQDTVFISRVPFGPTEFYTSFESNCTVAMDGKTFGCRIV